MAQQQYNTIGIDIGGTNLRFALVDHLGSLIAQTKVPTPKDNEALLTLLASHARNLVLKSPISVGGIGVGWPGPVDRKLGKIIKAPNITGLEHFPLTSFLSKELGLPCFLENDAKCAALGEKAYGAAKEYKHFVLLTFGTGIGGAIYIDDNLYYGKTGGAGEIGHMTIVEDGKPCPCGNKGCFERYASSIALERLAEEKTGNKLSSQQIVEDYESGEASAANLIERFTDHVATGIASIVNVFDPEAVLLSGGLFSSPHNTLIQLIEEKIRNRCFTSFQKTLKILPSTLQGSAGIVGAATLARTESLRKS
ncbi:MAG: ROK family protein [Proteobacteria bacterium]|jgi:glucokinase|nr:ROK family protein [Pseudomonadota bacterium]